MGNMQKIETLRFYGEALMETLNLIYWCRVGLGVIAALLCVAGWALTNTLFATILQGSSLAIIFYIITYYVLKMRFIMKVEKTSKLFTQGIGAYFMTWIVTWILLLSLTVPTAAFTYSPSNPKVDNTVTFDPKASYDIKGYITKYTWIFVFSNGTEEVTAYCNYITETRYTWRFDFPNGTVSNQQETRNPILNYTFKVPATYIVYLYVTDNDGFMSSPQVVTLEVENVTG